MRTVLTASRLLDIYGGHKYAKPRVKSAGCILTYTLPSQPLKASLTCLPQGERRRWGNVYIVALCLLSVFIDDVVRLFNPLLPRPHLHFTTPQNGRIPLLEDAHQHTLLGGEKHWVSSPSSRESGRAGCGSDGCSSPSASAPSTRPWPSSRSSLGGRPTIDRRRKLPPSPSFSAQAARFHSVSVHSAR